VLVVLAAGDDPTDAMRVAVAAAGEDPEASVSIAVVGGASYWPQWASIDSSFWLPLESVREETVRRSAEQVPDTVGLRLIDVPGWDGVRNELLAGQHDLVICAVKQRWASRTLAAVSDVSVVALGKPGPDREAPATHARPASQA